MVTIIGRRVSAGKGEHQKVGTVVAAEPSRKDHYGNYPIEVQWDNGTRTQTMSFWVNWIKEKVVWKWEYGVYVPFCPYCNELAYEHDSCVFCGKPYQWVEGEIQPTEVTRGEYTVIQATNNHVALYKNGRRIMHVPCQKKMSEAELLEQIDFYEKLFANDNREG